MSITSVGFLFFLVFSLIIYYNIPRKYQWLVLLADSLVFYFFNAAWYTFFYVILSAFSVYIATFLFPKHEHYKKAILIGTIILNISVLAILKYSNLAINTHNFFAELFEKKAIANVDWLPSLAISFYTLQLVSYLIDSYYGIIQPENNPLKVLLYTCFFPLMVSGPICRFKDLGADLYSEHSFVYANATSGMRRIAWGIAKKAVVADRLAIIVDYIFSHYTDFKGIWTIMASLLFTVELYFDFSGCMDILIGSALCFGIHLPENFYSPFFSKTIRELWQRWHITLGNWLKDYIMYPILRAERMSSFSDKCRRRFGKKGRIIPTSIAMFAVWTLMGLWHGNSWKYIIGEGWYFWIIIVISDLFTLLFGKKPKKNEHITFSDLFRILRTILLFSFGMIFFRAPDLFSAFNIIRGIFCKAELLTPLRLIYASVWKSFGGFPVFIAASIVILLQIAVDYLNYYSDFKPQTAIVKFPTPVRWSLYILLIICTILFGAYGKSSFIYFGF